MIDIVFFGTARLNLKLKNLSIEASDAASVTELLKKIAEKADVPFASVKQYLVYINEVNIDTLKRFRTKLKDGDKIMILSPSSGG